jgi:dienelactone hydrolase
MNARRRISLLIFLLPAALLPAITQAADSSTPAVTPAIAVGSEFQATDTLACGEEPNEDAKDCLAKLSWAPENFIVRLEASTSGHGNYLVRFPSPRPIGDSTNDMVSMEWFPVLDKNGAICTARGVVVVHESARSMTVGRLIARSLNGQGLHTFLIQLPGYGARREAGSRSSYEKVLPMMQQGIADVRRARDAVVALPMVDHSVIGLEGTSLGGFVTATVAGMDHGYDRVFILLAGGNVADVILHGSRDAEKVHAKLLASGLSDDQIKDAVRQIEPLRLAHRINPATTWLYSGTLDTVVPPRSSLALVKAAHLSQDHHIEFPADHYLGIFYLPPAISQISERMLEKVKGSSTINATHAAP